MKVLDLFSGIGGFALGLERAGMETAAFCEIDPDCRMVLKRHWPHVPIFEDITTLEGKDIESVDGVCGGFPCQDISAAGDRLGIGAARSGLWSEYFRLICELRPSFVLVENVSALLHRGMDKVLGDLASVGYDAEWECISAAAVGAPHIRDRVWILAYPGQEPRGLRGLLSRLSWDGCTNPFPEADRWRTRERGKNWEFPQMVPGIHPGMAAAWWRHQSSVARTADGLPRQSHRNGSCGNAVIPIIPEAIGRGIMAAMKSMTEAA